MRLVTILLFTFFLISIPKHSLLNAQETETTGSLEGVVYDENGVLPFANIFIEGTSIGSSSDDNGTFSIHKIPIGTYKILFL